MNVQLNITEDIPKCKANTMYFLILFNLTEKLAQ